MVLGEFGVRPSARMLVYSFPGAYILHIWLYLHLWMLTKDTLFSYLKYDCILGSSGQQYVIINWINWKAFPVTSLTFGFTSTHLPTS